MSESRARRVLTVLRRRPVLITVELIGLAVLLGVLAWAIRDVWADAVPRLRHADLTDLALAVAILAAYYLVFVIGWLRILAAYGIRIPYRVALQAEMLSMLAKYIPGGVWTPAARVVALRRFGVRETPVVLASILLEAGFSAVAGVGVFLVGLAIVGSTDAPLVPLVAFGVLVAILLYPVVFEKLARRLLRPFGAHAVMPLPARTTFSLLGVLCAHVAARRGGPLLPASLGRRGSAALVDPVPRRCERRRRDRRGAVRLRAVRAGSARGLGLRVAAHGRRRGGRARRDDPEPARDHGRRGGAASHRRAADPLAPCRTAARARRRARLAPDYGKRSLRGARSSSPPFRHSDGTRYARADCAYVALSASCCRIMRSAVPSESPSRCPSATPLWNA